MVLFVVVPSLLVRLLLAIAGVLRLAMFRSGVPQWIITITCAECAFQLTIHCHCVSYCGCG